MNAIFLGGDGRDGHFELKDCQEGVRLSTCDLTGFLSQATPSHFPFPLFRMKEASYFFPMDRGKNTFVVEDPLLIMS